MSGFPLEPGTRTLVGGWSVEEEVYAFWDVRRHVRFSTNSPSLQVNVQTLQSARRRGIATQRRPTRGGHEEVVVAVHPDSLAWYVTCGDGLHNAGEAADDVAELIDASPDEERTFLDADPSELVVARRYDLVQIIRAFRAAAFRPAVLRAYSYRCAVCGTALKLVDSAHIVPVASPGSTDEVANGLALCKLHHAAFDNALIGVRPDFRVILSDDYAARLRATRLDAGLEEFAERLPPTILLPTDAADRPSPTNLRTGMVARGWPDPG